MHESGWTRLLQGAQLQVLMATCLQHAHTYLTHRVTASLLMLVVHSPPDLLPNAFPTPWALCISILKNLRASFYLQACKYKKTYTYR